MDDIKEMYDELENYRPIFEEFAAEFGEKINRLIGYTDDVNLCINVAWMMGFLAGKRYGAEDLINEFKKELTKKEKHELDRKQDNENDENI